MATTATTAEGEKLLYTIQEVEALLGLGRTTLYQLLGAGKIRSVSIGRARRIPAAALNEFVASLSGGNLSPQ